MKKANLSSLVIVVVALGVCTLPLVLSSCGSSTDNEEVGQQIGDAMASIDESGGSTGALAMLAPESYRRTFLRLSPSDVTYPWYEQLLEKYADATACKSATTFGTCTGNVITRTFSDCTVSSATFSGTVTLTFADATVDATCQMTAAGHSITRVPAFTVTGRRGATLTVSKSGTVGQRITKGATAGTFTFSNDGIRRVFTNAAGTITYDYTTATTADMTVTGTTRATRVLDGGTLRVTDNLTSSTCDISPNDITWSAACNCAVSGSWTGTCSDGKTVSIEVSGCGTATLTKGSDSQNITFDRCESL